MQSTNTHEQESRFLQPAASCLTYAHGHEPFYRPATIDATGRYAALLDVERDRWLIADLAHARVALVADTGTDREWGGTGRSVSLHYSGPLLAWSSYEELDIVDLGSTGQEHGLRVSVKLEDNMEAVVGCFDRAGNLFAWVNGGLFVEDGVQVWRMNLSSQQAVCLLRRDNATLVAAACDQRARILCLAIIPGQEEKENEESAAADIHVLAPFAGWHRQWRVAGRPSAIAVHAKARYLALGRSEDIALYSLDGELLGSFEFDWPMSLDFHPSEPLLLVKGPRSLEVWEVGRGEFHLRTARRAHHELRNERAAWCLNGTGVITICCADCPHPARAHLYAHDLSGPVAVLGGTVRGVRTLLGQGETVCALLCDSSLMFFDPANIRPLTRIPLPFNKLRHVVVSRDGKRILTDGRRNELLVVQPRSWRRQSIRLPDDLDLGDFDVSPDPPLIVCLALRNGYPDGEWEGYLLLYAAEEPGDPVVKLPIGKGPVHFVRVDTSGRLAVTCGREMRVWDLRERRCVWSWRPESVRLTFSDVAWIRGDRAILAVLTDWRSDRDSTKAANAEDSLESVIFWPDEPRAVRVLRIDPEPWRVTAELDLEEPGRTEVAAYPDPEGKRLLLDTGHLVDVETMKVVARTTGFSSSYVDWRRSVHWRATTTGAAIGRLLEAPAVELVVGEEDYCALFSDSSFAGTRELLWEEDTATGEVSEITSDATTWDELVKLAGLQQSE